MAELLNAQLLATLSLTAVPVQQRFRVAIRLTPAFEYQIICRFECEAAFEIVAHSLVVRIGVILIVNDTRHASEGLANLVLRTNTVKKPVRQVLARYSQRGAVLHETDIVDVGHF